MIANDWDWLGGEERRHYYYGSVTHCNHSLIATLSRVIGIVGENSVTQPEEVENRHNRHIELRDHEFAFGSLIITYFY